jgi:linoleoyl-CoA desaturase
MRAKTTILFIVTFGAYGLILSGRCPEPVVLALCALMGAGIAGIGFGVSHDALHEAYASSPTWNRILGWSFDLMGANGYMWKLTHNVIHHTYTNIDGADDDLEVSPLLRLSPGTEWKPVHRFQHVYGFLAYSLSTLNWVFVKDYRYFLRRRLGPFRNRTHPSREVVGLFGWKAFYYAYTIVIPILVLRPVWWQFLLAYLTFHLTAGIILGVVFQLAHVVEETTYPLPGSDGRMDREWAMHQMETTSDFATGSRWLSWYVGGLNFQVEHHLFPKVCSVHYPAIREIVREVAREHSVSYHCHPTLGAAIRSHYSALARLGKAPGAPLTAAPVSAGA